MLTQADIDILKAPFDSKTLGVKVQSLSKDKTKAMIVVYLQHTDVADRIEQVDPNWQFEITQTVAQNNEVVVRAEMIIKGIKRANIGQDKDHKSAASDALKRCAMLFGVGRYLYDQYGKWVPYNESTDKYKVWTYAEVFSKGHVKAPISPKAENKPQGPTPVNQNSTTNELDPGGYILRTGKQQDKRVDEVPGPDLGKTLWGMKQNIGKFNGFLKSNMEKDIQGIETYLDSMK